MVLMLLECVGCVSSAPYLTQRLAPFGLDLHEFPDKTGRGVRTLRDRTSGEQVLSWSDDEVVLAERVLRKRRFDLAAAAAHASKAGTPLTDEALLASYIVCEEIESRNDWFLLYRSTLPAAQPSAISMDAPTLGLLPRCYARHAKATREYVSQQHAACVAGLEAVGAPTPPFDRFLQAFAHVRARSFALDEDVFGLEPRSPHIAYSTTSTEHRTRLALLPLLDLLNHRSGARVRVQRSKRLWRLVADDNYTAGDQVFNSYGNRGNVELLLNYGFAIGDNEHQRISFDAVELVDACLAAYPRTLGNLRVQENLTALLSEAERSRYGTAQNKPTLYTCDASEGNLRHGTKLRTTLATLRGIATKLGLSVDEARALPDRALSIMLRRRLVELDSCLADVRRLEVAGEQSPGWGLRGHVATLLETERATIEAVLGGRT